MTKHVELTEFHGFLLKREDQSSQHSYNQETHGVQTGRNVITERGLYINWSELGEKSYTDWFLVLILCLHRYHCMSDK